MGFDAAFARGLAWRVAALFAAIVALTLSWRVSGLAATRVVAALAVVAATFALWVYVLRTNRILARFVETLRVGDANARFDTGGGAGFTEVAEAFDTALARLRAERHAGTEELRFVQALLDDVPVALLVIDQTGAVEPYNKAARRLFGEATGARPEDYAAYGAGFAARLERQGAAEEMLLLNIGGRAQRAIVRTAQVSRLGASVRAITVQPAQGAFDTVEMAAQTDLVRVLTHEILNSLTPVTSLAATAAGLLADPELGADPRLDDARLAIGTLARRAEGLSHFIEGYRAISRVPEIKRQRFSAAAWADELAQLFTAEWPDLSLDVRVEPADLLLDADLDLMTQVLINLLRNAVDAATSFAPDPRIALDIVRGPDGDSWIDVSDNGPGIPPRLRQEIFLPFFTTRAKGNGVGLNLARQVVVGHGGTIEVVDGTGGAVMRIIMP